MNNKRLGNSFEQELAQIFYKHGFWVEQETETPRPQIT